MNGATPQTAGVASSVPLLDGDPGTAQTITLIRQAVHKALSNATVRATVAQALQGVPAFGSGADLGAVEALFEWPLKHVRFTNDPVGNEMIQDAEWTIQHGIGDCDDINGVLLPALFMSAGYPVRLVTISDDPAEPEAFTHIYSEVLVNGQWIPADAARPGAKLGATVPRFIRKRVWDLDTSSFTDLAGETPQPSADTGPSAPPPPTVPLILLAAAAALMFGAHRMRA